MLQARILFTIGLWVAVLPFLGFPKNIKNILFILTGLFIVYIGLVVYKKIKLSKESTKKNSSETFMENRDFIEK